jgi:hypothetical protein
MAIPKTIQINRIEDYHTHYIGKYDNGKQFWAYEHFISVPIPDEKNWQKYRHEYVVLYLFDENGKYVSNKYWYAGTTSDLNCETDEKIEEMVDELGEI